MKRFLLLPVLSILFSMTVSAQSNSTGEHKGHEWVDLGLSVKWATCNIGALSPSDYGGYFAWGEIAAKSNYTVDNSKTSNKNLCDFSGDKKFDAARANWGGEWRIPTDEEYGELIKNCSWTWTTQNGHAGFKVTSKTNGESIFLPAAGCRDGDALYDAGVYGQYWCSTPEIFDDNTFSLAGALCFGTNDYNMYLCARYFGHTIRPVLD
jgi:hypothetical protein